MDKPILTKAGLRSEAKRFATIESRHADPSLFGVTDGKAVGTYFEHKFRAYVHDRYAFADGSSARGIDFPELGVDVKVTSIKQPQSSCPFRNARQKIFGLGYDLLVFIYEKSDDPKGRTGRLKVLHTFYVDSARTGDFQMTRGIRSILETDGNADDLVAFMHDRMLPVDDIEARSIADEILQGQVPAEGLLTISNALQWRLQYRRLIDTGDDVEGFERL